MEIKETQIVELVVSFFAELL